MNDDTEMVGGPCDGEILTGGPTDQPLRREIRYAMGGIDAEHGVAVYLLNTSGPAPAYRYARTEPAPAD